MGPGPPGKPCGPQGPRHAYAIGRWISQRTDGAFDLEEGVLYPALYRFHKEGLAVEAILHQQKD
jgi:DNA-binding PadR family transcriptional regulator